MTTETEIIRKKWLLSAEQWLHGLVSAFITGGATVICAQSGLAIANTADSSFHTMDLKQLGAAALFSGLFGAAAYLKQSPLPKVPPGTEVTVEETKTTTISAAPPGDAPNP